MAKGKNVTVQRILRWGLLLALMILGFFSNSFNLTLFFNVDLIFGSVFVVLVIVFYGPWWGVLASAAAGSYTYILWNHPYAIIIFVLEAAFIGFIYEKKKINLILLNSIYWLVLGMPLVYLFYHGVMGIDNTGTLLIMFKQSVNGILNTFIAVLIAIPLAQTGNREAESREKSTLRFTNLLFTTIIGFVLVPYLTFTVITSRLRLEEIERDIENNLAERSDFVTYMFSSWFRENQIESEIIKIALNRSMMSGGPPGELDRTISDLFAEDDDMYALALTDSSNTLITTISSEEDESSGILRAERLERIQKDSGGRGITFVPRKEGGEDLLVTITPIQLNNGGGKGVLFIFKKSSLLEELLIELLAPSNTNIILMDRENRLIYQSRDVGEAFLSVVSAINGDSEVVRWLPEAMRNISVMQRWKEAVYVTKAKVPVIPEWFVISYSSVAPYQEQIYRDSSSRLFIITLSIYLSAIFSQFLAARFVRPIRKLQGISTNLPDKLKKPGIGGWYNPEWPRTAIVEINQLTSNFRSMADSLRRMFCELREANDQLSREKERVEEASRIKSRFLANMSHDIRTPTTAIKGMAEMVLEDTSLTRQQIEYITSIEESSSTLLTLLNNILDLSKIEAGKLSVDDENFSIPDLVEKIRRLFEVSARMKHLEFSIELDEELPQWYIGDPLRIQQILMNLVGNALKFTAKGGIALRVEKGSVLPVFTGHETGRSFLPVTFFVKDSGLGIAKDKQSDVFESFSQSDPSIQRRYGGSGLGLTISKELVTLMGGSIAVESEYGRGSTFYFTLPLKRGTPPAADPGGGENGMEINQNAPIRLILADDNEINRKVSRRLLEKTGFYVDVAANGKEVLQLLEKDRYDMILMDVHMPEMDGIEATRRIRREGGSSGQADIPVIALTAGVLEEGMAEWRVAGMNDALQKPLNIEALKRIIQKYLLNPQL